MTQHTHGRLHVNNDVGIYSSKGRLIASTHTSITQLGNADARRLVAAWNACEGIPNELLEQSRCVPEACIALIIQRDELLAALKVMLRDYAAVYDIGDVEMQPAIYQARAAIAKVEKS